MRYPSLFFVLLATILLTAAQTQAASPMIISGNPDGPPVSWDKRDKLMGVGPEVAAKIMSELKVPFTMTVESSWQQVQDKAKSGAIDMIVSA